ncbi:DUF6192 family protein [Streptomyces sp. NPDC005900]|uniref:DUF6192 family protein n=1 Tax=Streptomyces sp. NPDC005900 TaxID=3154569 RepID=UPI0033D2D43D
MRSSRQRSLTELAEDIGLKFSTGRNARWTVSRWSEEHRQSGVSFTVHRILGGIEDNEERFAAIRTPPQGKSRWTPDDASWREGCQVDTCVSEPLTMPGGTARARDEPLRRRRDGPWPSARRRTGDRALGPPPRMPDLTDPPGPRQIEPTTALWHGYPGTMSRTDGTWDGGREGCGTGGVDCGWAQ